METSNPQDPMSVLHSVFQLGVVVEDLETVMASMKRIYGLEPAMVVECNYPRVTYKGEDVDARARIAKFDQFGVVIEFIQPSGDDSMWSDALKASPNGAVLHHIRFNDVPDNDVLTAMMAERGVALLQEGASVVHPNCKFTFYDTEKDLGFVSEVVTDVNAK